MRVIITGATGMVGHGVLLECLASKEVEEICLITRRSLGMNHPKVKEIVHTDFSLFTAIEKQLSGYDACFHCMGVSSIGMDEATFSKLTYDITKALANALYRANPLMVVTYVSGTGTDSSEVGKTMWARVKGRTENMLFGKRFKDVYAFRPGLIVPVKGVRTKTAWINFLYIVLQPLYPLLLKAKNITTSENVGLAMINVVREPQDCKVLEGADINRLALLRPKDEALL